MMPGLLGKKIGMTRMVDPSGEVTPVTVVQAGPCVILQVKTTESDGYNAVQLGIEDVKPHRATKPRIGHCGKAGVGAKRFAREFRTAGDPEFNTGDVLTVGLFTDAEVKYVDVTSRTKGKGFAGVMKRWNMGGQPATHGTERKHRSPGSIGGHSNKLRGRGVKKGKHMSGHLGDEQVTQRCLKLMAVDAENNLLLIKGSVPGPRGSLVLVRRSKTRQ